jgi:F-type H+-transporting ATPase subunit gamma
MPSLKSLKNRIASVKSTQKITKAKQMVAAAKLRRAEERAKEARPYTERMEAVLANLTASAKDNPNAPALLRGTGKDRRICSSSRPRTKAFAAPSTRPSCASRASAL